MARLSARPSCSPHVRVLRLALDAMHLDILARVEGLQERPNAAAVATDVTVHSPEVGSRWCARPIGQPRWPGLGEVWPRRESERGAFAFESPDGRLSSAHARPERCCGEAGKPPRMRAPSPRPPGLRCVRDRSDSYIWGIMEEAPVLRRAEALVRPAINSGSQQFPGGMCCERRHQTLRMETRHL